MEVNKEITIRRQAVATFCNPQKRAPVFAVFAGRTASSRGPATTCGAVRRPPRGPDRRRANVDGFLDRRSAWKSDPLLEGGLSGPPTNHPHPE